MYWTEVVAVWGITLNLFIVVVSLYELHYRKNIEGSRKMLTFYIKRKLGKLITILKVPMEQKARTSFSNELDKLNTIVGRPDDFLRWRSMMAIPIVLEFALGSIILATSTITSGIDFVIFLFALMAAISILFSSPLLDRNMEDRIS